MSIVEIVFLLITILLFVVGLLGNILPTIPGLQVIWVGIIFYAMVTHFSAISFFAVAVVTILMIIGTVIDLVSGIYGARKYGSSWCGLLGAMLGSLFGLLFFNLFGFVVGTFFGAVIGEIIRYRKIRNAIRAGIGTIIGLIVGAVIKIFISFLMIAIFFLSLFL